MKLLILVLFLAGCTPEPAVDPVPVAASAPAASASAASASASAAVHEWHYYPPDKKPYVYRGTSPYSDFDYRRHRF